MSFDAISANMEFAFHGFNPTATYHFAFLLSHVQFSHRPTRAVIVTRPIAPRQQTAVILPPRRAAAPAQ